MAGCIVWHCWWSVVRQRARRTGGLIPRGETKKGKKWQGKPEGDKGTGGLEAEDMGLIDCI